MTKRWFRFRSLGHGSEGGKVDYKTEVFAASVNLLKIAVAQELAVSGAVPHFSYVDRVKVNVFDDGRITFEDMLVKDALDGRIFADDVLGSRLYKELKGENDG